MGIKSSKPEQLQSHGIAVRIRAIKLAAPHARIKTPFDHDNPYFATKSLVLWARDKPNPVPATVPLGDQPILSVILDYNVGKLGHVDKGLTWKLRGRVLINNTRFRIHSKPASTSSINGSIAVHVTVEFLGGSDVPWGLKDDVMWSVDIGTKALPDMILHSVQDFCQTPIELYGICKELVGWYLRPGVPLDMLRIFVLPASSVTSIGNLDDWVKWVVERCHASRADQDCKVPKDERIHAFRYDVVS
jgi:hypothetical protein